MSMYDTVIATCPECGEEVEFQSKAGNRLFERYPIDSVPIAIATDISGEIKRCKCGNFVTINLPQHHDRVEMIVS